MSEPDSIHGLNCPQCGGMVAVPEGARIVACPYCELRSFVRGERGILRFGVPRQVGREKAEQALRGFLSSTWAIAPAVARQAQLQEALLMYLPFWSVWGRVAGWVFGEKRVGSGDKRRWEAREVRVMQEMSWNGAACDVGEFGVNRVPPAASNLLQPFNPDALHAEGMVFEPVGAFSQAQASAEAEFESEVQNKAGLERLGQAFVRTIRRRYALVYHPLWVMRYLFRGRAFQVVVDGLSGQVLYGKAPGNTLYRAAILVFGMAVGAFLAVDVPVMIVFVGDDSDIIWLALASLVVGLVIMAAAYRTFRHGEQYEFRHGRSEVLGGVDVRQVIETVTSSGDIEKWLNRLN